MDTFVTVDFLIVVGYQLDAGPIVEASPWVDFELEVVDVGGVFELGGQDHLDDVPGLEFELELDSFFFAEFHVLSLLPVLIN